MTRRWALRGLLQLPFDWLVLLWLLATALTQWLTRLSGQRVIKVRGVTQSVSDVGVGVEVRERLALFLLVTLVFFVLPAYLRRHVHEWRSRASSGQKSVFDAPVHRDGLFWLYVMAVVGSFLSTNLVPHLDFSAASSGIDVPLRELFVVDGSYLWTILGLAALAIIDLAPVAVLSLIRSGYRRPSRTSRRGPAPHEDT
jgi:hypothetical protein